MSRKPDSTSLRQTLNTVLSQLRDFITVIETKTSQEIELKEITLIAKLANELRFDENLRLTNKDRIEVQKLYFSLSWEVRSKIRRYFPKLDSNLTERIFHQFSKVVEGRKRSFRPSIIFLLLLLNEKIITSYNLLNNFYRLYWCRSCNSYFCSTFFSSSFNTF